MGTFYFYFPGKLELFRETLMTLSRLIRTAEWVDPGLGRMYYETFAQAYSRVLGRAQAKGELRPVDPDVMAYCLIGIAESLHMRWMEWEGKAPPDRWLDAALSLIAQGIALAGAPPLAQLSKEGN